MNEICQNLILKLTAFLIIMLSGLSAQIFGQTVNEIQSLSSNQKIERSIEGNEIHRYKTELRKDEFFQIRVEQKGVDVVVKLFDANKNLLVRADSPNLHFGFETLSWIGDKDDYFEIEISAVSSSPNPGKYVLQRNFSRLATEADRKRVSNEKSFFETTQMLGSNDETELAKIRPLLETVYQEWKSENDAEMVSLTEDFYQFIKVAQNESLNQQELVFYSNYSKKQLQDEADAVAAAVLVFRKFGAKRYEASLLLRYGYINTLMGEAEIGLRSFNTALNIDKSIGYRRGEATANFIIGRTLHLLGESQKSLDYLDSALKIFQTAGDKPGTALVLINLGFVNEDLHNYKEALDSYYKANEEAYQAKDPITFIDSDSAIASFMAGAGKYQDALKRFLELLKLRKKFGDRRGEAYDLNNIGFAYFRLNEKEKAIDYYEQALFTSKTIDDESGEADASSNLMFVLESANQLQLAILCGKRAVNNYQKLRTFIQGLDHETQKSFLGTVEGTYRKLADLLITNGRISEAEQVLAMLKEEETFTYLRRDDQVVKDLIQTVSLSAKEREALTRYDELADKITAIGKEFGELDAKRKNYDEGRFPDQARYDELKNQLADATTVFQKFLDELKTKFGQKDERVVSVDSSLQNTLKRLKADRTAVMSVIVGEKRLNLIVTTADTQRAHTIDISEKDINKLVADFRQTLTDPKIDPRPAGQKLYDVLVKPIETDLAGINADTILWSLDGTLRYIPDRRALGQRARLSRRTLCKCCSNTCEPRYARPTRCK